MSCVRHNKAANKIAAPFLGVGLCSKAAGLSDSFRRSYLRKL